MVETELKELLDQIQNRKCEEQVVEVKAAHKGCPEKLYDTFSQSDICETAKRFARLSEREPGDAGKGRPGNFGCLTCLVYEKQESKSPPAHFFVYGVLKTAAPAMQKHFASPHLARVTIPQTPKEPFWTGGGSCAAPGQEGLFDHIPDHIQLRNTRKSSA